MIVRQTSFIFVVFCFLACSGSVFSLFTDLTGPSQRLLVYYRYQRRSSLDFGEEVQNSGILENVPIGGRQLILTLNFSKKRKVNLIRLMRTYIFQIIVNVYIPEVWSY